LLLLLLLSQGVSGMWGPRAGAWTKPSHCWHSPGSP
jgi:hypothetical protein